MKLAAERYRVDGVAAHAPELSVIMPAYNVAPWVEETLASIFDQWGVDLEVIVVDDESTDGSWEILQRIASREPRLFPVRAIGSGGAQARNYGVTLARAPYICFSDADDIVPPGAYRELLEAARSSEADITIGDFLKFSSAKTWSITGNWDAFQTPLVAGQLGDRPDLIRNRACWNRVFAKEFWVRLGMFFPSVPRSNDIVPMTKALTAAQRITVITRPVYLYRERPGASSMTAKAGNPENVRSYLEQEVECAALVTGLANEKLSRAYWRMVLNSDTWNHVTRLLRDADGSADVSQIGAICGAVAALLALAEPEVWWKIAPRKRVVYSLLAANRFSDAQPMVSGEGSEFAALAVYERLVAERFGASTLAVDDVASLRDSTLRELLDALINPETTHSDLQEWITAAHRSGIDSLPSRQVPVLAREQTRKAALFQGDVDELARLIQAQAGSEFIAEQVIHSCAGVIVEWRANGVHPIHLRALAVHLGSGTHREIQGSIKRIAPDRFSMKMQTRRFPRTGDWRLSVAYDNGWGWAEHPIYVVPDTHVTQYRRIWRLEFRTARRGEIAVTKKRAQIVRGVRAVIRRGRRLAARLTRRWHLG